MRLQIAAVVLVAAIPVGLSAQQPVAPVPFQPQAQTPTTPPTTSRPDQKSAPQVVCGTMVFQASPGIDDRIAIPNKRQPNTSFNMPVVTPKSCTDNSLDAAKPRPAVPNAKPLPLIYGPLRR